MGDILPMDDIEDAPIDSTGTPMPKVYRGIPPHAQPVQPATYFAPGSQPKRTLKALRRRETEAIGEGRVFLPREEFRERVMRVEPNGDA